MGPLPDIPRSSKKLPIHCPCYWALRKLMGMPFFGSRGPIFFSALPKKATRVTRAGASVSSQVPYFWVTPGIHHPSSQAPSGPQRGELSTMRAAGEYTGFVPDMQPLGWPYLVRGLIGKLMCICIFTLHNIYIYIYA